LLASERLFLLAWAVSPGRPGDAANRSHERSSYPAGGMFWFIRKTLSGSKRRLRAASRS
jgi:hypothetical protein